MALWLVDSGITNPQMEDVVNFANKGDYEEAKKAIYIELDKKNLRKVYEEIELPLIPLTKKMEERGIKIDRELLEHLGTTYHAEVEKLEKKIHELAGTDFNISSPKPVSYTHLNHPDITI